VVEVEERGIQVLQVLRGHKVYRVWWDRRVLREVVEVEEQGIQVLWVLRVHKVFKG
jgi:hypothetical protein